MPFFDKWTKVQQKAEELRNLSRNIRSKRAEQKHKEELAKATALRATKHFRDMGQFSSKKQQTDFYMMELARQMRAMRNIKINTNASLRQYLRNTTRSYNAVAQAVAAEAAAASLGPPPRKAELEDLRDAWFENDKGMSFENYIEAAGLRSPPSNAELEDLREAWFENDEGGITFENYVKRHRKGGSRRKTRRTRRRKTRR